MVKRIDFVLVADKIWDVVEWPDCCLPVTISLVLFICMVNMLLRRLEGLKQFTVGPM